MESRPASPTGGSCCGSDKTCQIISPFPPCQTLGFDVWCRFWFHLCVGRDAGVPFAAQGGCEVIFLSFYSVPVRISTPNGLRSWKSECERMGPCRAPSCAGSAKPWNGCVEKDLKDHLIPDPCHGPGYLPPDQVVQDHIQPGLEHFKKVTSVQ